MDMVNTIDAGQSLCRRCIFILHLLIIAQFGLVSIIVHQRAERWRKLKIADAWEAGRWLF